MEIRPFSTQNFDQKLQNFQNFIEEVTFKDSELSTDERRTKILGIFRNRLNQDSFTIGCLTILIYKKRHFDLISFSQKFISYFGPILNQLVLKEFSKRFAIIQIIK